MAVGILEFNGIQVDLKKYAKFLAQYKPKGKDRMAIAQMLNYKPMQVAGTPGKPMATRAGGRKGIICYDTVHFPTDFDSQGNITKTEEGTLRYYERKIPHQSPMGAPTYEPVRLRFQSGIMNIENLNDAKLLFMVCSSKQKENIQRREGTKEAGWSNAPAVWEIVKPGISAERNSKKLSAKFDAMQRVKVALVNNQELAKQLYESQGHTDWELYLNLNSKTQKWEGDFREIENILLMFADTNPNKVLELLSDTALDIKSKIVQGINKQILAQEGNSWLWGNKADGGKYKDLPAAEKLITKIPAGKGSTKEQVIDWFCDFLKGEPNLMSEINTELDEVKAST